MDLPNIDPAQLRQIRLLQDTAWKDLPALQAAAAELANITPPLAVLPGLQPFVEAQAAMFAASAQSTKQIQSVMESIQVAWSKYVEDIAARIDWAGLRRALNLIQKYLPANLRGIGDLEKVHDVTHEGIPLAWIPRTEIVRELLSANDAEARLQLLVEHTQMILDDCHEILTDRPGEIAAQTLAAVQTLRAGHASAAQSHAANIVDSLVLALTSFDRDARSIVVKIGGEELDNLGWTAVGECLTFRPTVKAMTSFRVERGDDVPPHFSRHATAHAVGQDGVFTDTYALIAVMLATSLTVHLATHA